LMGWEVPSDASGTALFGCLNLTTAQAAIYRINLASIRLAQAQSQLEKMGYLAGHQAPVDIASRYLDNAKGNFTAANYAAATSNAIASETVSRFELASSWASKETEEITGRLLVFIVAIFAVAIVLSYLLHRYRGKINGALVRERDFLGVAVASVIFYFAFLAITTIFTGIKFSASFFPDSATAFILAVFIPNALALIPAGILFVGLFSYVSRKSKTTGATSATYASLFLVMTTVVYVSMVAAVVVVNTSGVPWYASDVVLCLEFFYLVISSIAFAIFGVVSFTAGVALRRMLGFGKDARKGS
jgi:hypothetical protein